MSRLTASNVSVSFGSLVVLDGVSLSIGAGDRTGIVAPNGVGKSTLLRVLAGELEPDSGIVTRSPSMATVLRLAQEPDIRPGESLAEHLAGALRLRPRRLPSTRRRRRWRAASTALTTATTWRCGAGWPSAAPTCPSAWLRSPKSWAWMPAC